MFHTDVVKVGCCICCSCTCILQESVSNVSSVFSYVRCKIVYLDIVYVSHICCMCFICILCMFAMVSCVFSSVSEACFKCFIYLQTYVASIISRCFKSRSDIAHGIRMESGRGTSGPTSRPPKWVREKQERAGVRWHGRGVQASARETNRPGPWYRPTHWFPIEHLSTSSSLNANALTAAAFTRSNLWRTPHHDAWLPHPVSRAPSPPSPHPHPHRHRRVCPNAVTARPVSSNGVLAGATHDVGLGRSLGDGAPRGPFWAAALLGLLLLHRCHSGPHQVGRAHTGTLCFQVFQTFQTYVQAFYLDVTKVDLEFLHMLQWQYTHIPSLCLRCFKCMLQCFIWMF
jgi:hypothetical protein